MHPTCWRRHNGHMLDTAGAAAWLALGTSGCALLRNPSATPFMCVASQRQIQGSWEVSNYHKLVHHCRQRAFQAGPGMGLGTIATWVPRPTKCETRNASSRHYE